MSLPLKKQKTGNSYTNYSIASNNEQLDIINDISQLTKESFFNDYIKIRKPVRFDIPDSQQIIPIVDFKLDNLLNTLKLDNNDQDDDDEIQVEKKFDDGFGSGQKRIKMKLKDLITEIKNGSDNYYKTTQYDFDDPDQEENDEDEEDDEEDDEDEEEEEEGDVQFDKFSDTSSIDMNNLHDDFEDLEEDDDFEAEDEEDNDNLDEELKKQFELEEANYRIKELYQSPLTNLVHHPEILPIRPSFFNLIPQQINIWLGSSGNKTQQDSAKEFNIDGNKSDLGLGKQLPGKIHGSSSGLHHDHADNLYILIQGKKRFTLYSPKDAFKLYTIGKIHEIYNSGVIDYEVDGNSPFWKHVRDDGAIVEEILHWKLEQCDDKEEKKKLLDELQNYIKQRKFVNKKNKDDTNKASLDPPSFSKIPPALLHLDEISNVEQLKTLKKFSDEHFPGFLQLNKIEVWLDKPGQMLYLPAGWFHEVSSFGNNKTQDDEDDEGVHIAINYWFIPPNKNDVDNCYQDDYWPEDWKKTKDAIELIKKKNSQ